MSKKSLKKVAGKPGETSVKGRSRIIWLKNIPDEMVQDARSFSARFPEQAVNGK